MTGLRAIATPRGAATVVAVTLMWCGLWREISVANVLAGLAVAVAIMASGMGPAATGRLNVIALVKLFAVITIDLIKATWTVAFETITPGNNTQESVIAVALPPGHRRYGLLLTIAITITPGTAVVDISEDGSIVYLHLLYHESRDDTVAHTLRLARMAAEAWPEPDPAPDAGRRPSEVPS
ncbi:MAG: Na+/H+ antiporter subunit E [Actinomycetota bacterium]